MPWELEECIAEGNQYIEYMLQNFDSMIDGTNVKHFNIHYTDYEMLFYSQVLRKKYRGKIQPYLCTWLMEEATSGRLFTCSNWELEHEDYDYPTIYMGTINYSYINTIIFSWLSIHVIHIVEIVRKRPIVFILNYCYTDGVRKERGPISIFFNHIIQLSYHTT